MTWLKNNYTTLAMALVLSLLTVGLLTVPGEDNPPVRLSIRFHPEVKAPFGSVEYWVDDKKYTDRIPVTVSGDREQIRVLDLFLVCRPIIDERRFPPDARETKIEITEKDFDLTTDLAKRIRIVPFTVRITYAPMTFMKLAIRVSAADIQEADSRFQVESVRAIPPDITVRLPVDKVEAVKSLAIRPIRAAGQIESFKMEGRINTELPDLKDVKATEPFFIAVELREVPFKAELAGVPLHLSHSPIPGLKADLIDRPVFTVTLEGPKELVERIRAEQVHVYVKLEWTPATEPGDYPLPIRCELADEVLRKSVRVRIVAGQPIMAAVRVTRG